MTRPDYDAIEARLVEQEAYDPDYLYEDREIGVTIRALLTRARALEAVAEAVRDGARYKVSAAMAALDEPAPAGAPVVIE